MGNAGAILGNLQVNGPRILNLSKPGPGGQSVDCKLGARNHKAALVSVADRKIGINRTTHNNTMWAATMHERIVTMLDHLRRLRRAEQLQV